MSNKESEKVLFSDKDLKITESAIFIEEQKYLISQIEAVDKIVKPGKGHISLILVATGISLLFMSSSKIAGTVLIALALIILMLFRKRYLLRIQLHEIILDVCVTTDESRINTLMDVIHQATGNKFQND